MLKKANRLAKNKDVQTTLARGRNFFNPFFTIKFFSQPKEKRFTVVVSTKVFKNAVRRNRLKRLLREYLQKRLPDFKSGDYVIIVRPKVSQMPESEILKQFSGVCIRLK